MKWIIACFTLFLFSPSFCQKPGIDPGIASTEKKGSLPGFIKDGATFTSASSDFTISYARCSWNIDPSLYTISGSVFYKVLLTKDAGTLVFDLDNSLVVDSVVTEGNALSFLQDVNKTLSISLPHTLSAGSTDSLSIYYHGTPANKGFGSFTETAHNGVPVIWTLSEPYGARDWWPCRNGLDDKIDSLDIFITHPSQYAASANGLLTDTATAGLYTITHFKHRYPIATYLVGIAVTNYQTFTQLLPLQQGNMPVTTTVYPESFTYFQDNIHNLYNALKLYDAHFGPYPFSKEHYGQTQFSWGGGMEHQSNSFVTYADEYLMAHELAHQWFGDKITTSSWQDIWLNEGFATYLADFFYSEYYEPGELKRIAQQSVDYATQNPHGSVWVDDTTDINRIFDYGLTYKKGAMLLRSLRWRLGDSVFFKGIRQYIDDPSLRYRFARTADLQQNLESASGKKLSLFFNQWFYGKGYPSFNVQWSWQDGYMYLQVNETTSDASTSFFATPLQLHFSGAANNKDVIINIDQNITKLALPLTFKPDSVLIDPAQYIVSKNNVSHQGNISDLYIDYPFLLYPNPASNLLYIKLAGIDTVHSQMVRIVSSSGTLLLNKSFRNISNNLISIPVTQLSSGVYFIILQDEKGNLVKRKFIKQ